MTPANLLAHGLNEDDFTEILDQAQANAKTGKEMDFVDETRGRFATYGLKMRLSEKQLAWLHAIAGDSE